MISDSDHYKQCLIRAGTPLFSKIKENQIVHYSICKCQDYSLEKINEKMVLILMDAEPLGTPKSNVLGSPENYDTFNSAVKLEPAVDVLEYMTVGKPY